MFRCNQPINHILALPGDLVCPSIGCPSIFIGAHLCFLFLFFCCPTKFLNQYRISIDVTVPDCSVYKNRQLKRGNQANKHMPLTVLHKFDSSAPQGILIKCRSAFKLQMLLADGVRKWTDSTNCCGCLMSLKCLRQQTGDKLVLGQIFVGKILEDFISFFPPAGSG